MVFSRLILIADALVAMSHRVRETKASARPLYAYIIAIICVNIVKQLK